MIESWVVLDGRCVPEGQAAIPVTDRGFLLGDGAFTTIKVAEGHPEYYDEHIQQLCSHCAMLGIAPPSIARNHVDELIERNQAQTGTWRLKIVVTGGSSRSLDLTVRNSGHIVMLLHPYLTPPATHEKLTLFPIGTDSLLSNVKSLSYLERLWIRQRAHQLGFSDAIVTTPEGYLLETAFANLFWIADNILYYPDPALPYLFGVTLATQIRKAEEDGIVTVGVQAKLDDLPNDARIFICNSMIGVVPVTGIQDRQFLNK